MTQTSPPHGLARLQRVSFLVGTVALALCALAVGFATAFQSEGNTSGWFERGQFFRSYLIAYLVVLGPVLGAMAILMVQHLTGGAWGAVLRPVLETATRTTPFVALLFLPLLLGITDIYPWARWTEQDIAESTLLRHKSLYLNESGFCFRAAIYLVVWSGLALLLTRLSGCERTPEEEARLRRLSGPGLVVYSLTVTLAAVDWVMSLEPLWFSTIFGMLFASGQVLAAMAFGILIVILATRGEGVEVPRGPMQDLGSLMLAMVMVWAYMAFSQFLLIWSGNLPEETPWYLKRLEGGWQVIAVALILVQFVLPFLLLLSRDLKRDARSLAIVAGVVLLMRVTDLYWMIGPAYNPYQGMRLHWMDVATLIGVCGVWFGWFLRGLRQQDLTSIAGWREHNGHS